MPSTETTERIGATYIIMKPGETPLLQDGSFTVVPPYHQVAEDAADAEETPAPAPEPPPPIPPAGDGDQATEE